MKRKLLFLALFSFASLSQAQEKISVLDQTVMERENFEPAIPRPAQEKIAEQKLKALESKFGRKPNILIFLVDDLGWGDIGVNGGGVTVGSPTPNIDRLGLEGKQFKSFYSTPTCTSSRAALMTGRIPQRSGLTRPILSGDKLKTNPWKVEIAQAKLLGAVGYKTALYGKWHIGEGENMLPHEVGFDFFFGLPAVQSDYTQFLVDRRYSDMINNPEKHELAFKMQPKGLIEGVKGGPRKVGFPINNLDDMRQVDAKLKEHSVQFIKDYAGKQPFFLVHSFTAIHNDTYCGKDYIGKSPSAMPVRDALVETDDIVGEIMKALEESGELENTLVFFTSDNGPNLDAFPDCGTTPFRGGKGSTWEGGTRVPGIAYWKGMIEPGQESNELIDLTDIYMTSLRLGGNLDKKLPNNLYYDGIDQTAFMLAKDGHSKRQAEFMWNMESFNAIRWNDYKVHYNVMLDEQKERWLDASVQTKAGVSPWTFNLTVDPKETRSQGHMYFEWGHPFMIALMKRHLETMKKYPNTDLGLAL